MWKQQQRGKGQREEGEVGVYFYSERTNRLTELVIAASNDHVLSLRTPSIICFEAADDHSGFTVVLFNSDNRVTNSNKPANVYPSFISHALNLHSVIGAYLQHRHSHLGAILRSPIDPKCMFLD